MQKRLYGLIVIFLFLLPVAVSATQPQQAYSKIFLTPFYTASMVNNNNYNFTVTINPPDGLSSVQSAIISFDIYLNPSVNFTAQVNGKPCNTYFFYVSTTYASAGQARVTFDCSNEVNKKGSYVITLRPSGANTGAATGWLDLTYMNNPFGSFKAYGTEYQIGQNGTLFIKLIDSNELPINSGFCSLTAYYPNKTIKFMDNAPTTFLENGLYYKDFFVPLTEGLYIADASCVYADTVYRYVPSEDCGYDGNIAGGTSPQPLTFSEVDCVGFQTTGGGTYQNFTFNYTSINLINLSAISQIDVNWVGQVGAANANIQIYNWNASVWDSLGTSLASTGITLSCGNNVYITRVKSQNFTSYVRNNTIKTRIFRSGTASIITDSMEIVLHNNGSVVATLRGSSEIHVNNIFSNLTVNINISQLNDIFGNLTDIKNYLIVINGTTYQINQSQYLNYISLLTAINSVNSTANYNSYLLREVNQSVFNLSIAQTGYFQQVLAYLNDINYSLNTTIEYKLDLINGTVFQINQSQLIYYTNLLAAIDSVNTSVNNINFSNILNYLMVINGTTQQINSSQFLYYSNLLNSISSVNDTQNSNYINLYNLLLEINQTGNTTLEFVASINQSLLTYYSSLYNSIISLNDTQNQHFMDIMEFLASINFSINTTMEYKLDLINQTVFQINDTLSNQNFTVDFSQVLAAISQVNTTANQNQQYLIEINGTLYQLNQSEAQHFIQIMQAISDLNLTMNTTLLGYLIGINNTTSQINNTLIIINGNILSLNSSLYQYYLDIYVILKDINFTTNTTLENKLDFINSTTWQNYLILQNLTIGNVSVSADVNWTQGYLETTFLTFSDQINGEGIELLTETVTCLTNTTLQHWLNGTKCIQGVCHAYNETLVELCNYGCSNNICLPQPTIQYGFALGFALIAIGGIYMAYRGFGRR